jgi:hypothetical protein
VAMPGIGSGQMGIGQDSRLASAELGRLPLGRVKSEPSVGDRQRAGDR